MMQYDEPIIPEEDEEIYASLYRGPKWATVTTGRPHRKRKINPKLLDADFGSEELKDLNTFKEAEELRKQEEARIAAEPKKKDGRGKKRKKKDEGDIVDSSLASGIVTIVDEAGEEQFVITQTEDDPAAPPSVEPATKLEPIEEQPPANYYFDSDLVEVYDEKKAKSFASVEGCYDIGKGIPIVAMEPLDFNQIPILREDMDEGFHTYMIHDDKKLSFRQKLMGYEHLSGDEFEPDGTTTTKKKAPAQRKKKTSAPQNFDPDDFEWTPQLEKDDLPGRRGRPAKFRADYWEEEDETPIYHCDTCNFQTLMKRDFIKHLKTHDLTGPRFQCDKCTFRTTSKSGFLRHYDVHRNREMLQCEKCEFQTVSHAALKRHLFMHDSDQNFLCNKCDFRSPFKAQMKKHREIHDPKILRRCEECEFATFSKVEFRRHCRTEHEPFTYECEQCEFVTNLKTEFNNHIRMHSGQSATYKCPQCDYSVATFSDLQKHQEEHEQEAQSPKFSCTECNMHFRQQVHLYRHEIYRHPATRASCESCHFECAARNPDLFIHIKCQHGDDELELALRRFGGEYFQCPVCKLEMFTRRDRKQHMKEHRADQEERLLCNQCSFVTDNESRMKRHELSHSHERPFQCSQCDYRATHKDHVLRHLRAKHNIEVERIKRRRQSYQRLMEEDVQGQTLEPKVFGCRHCSMRFQKLISLWKHVKTEHPDVYTTEPELEACVLCDFTTSNRKMLLSHLRKHSMETGFVISGQDVYACMLCPFTCSLRRTFYIHLRKKHKVSIMLRSDGPTGVLLNDSQPSQAGMTTTGPFDPNYMPMQQGIAVDSSEVPTMMEHHHHQAQGGDLVEMDVHDQAVQLEQHEGGADGVTQPIQLTEQQLASLKTGDYIDIGGQLYKVEFQDNTGVAGDAPDVTAEGDQMIEQSGAEAVQDTQPTQVIEEQIVEEHPDTQPTQLVEEVMETST